MKAKPCEASLSLVRKSIDRLHAFGQSLQHGLAPAARTVRRGLLVGHLVGLREEVHGGLFRRDVLFHLDGEFHFATGLTFEYRKHVNLRQLLRSVRLCEAPLFHHVYLTSCSRAFASTFDATR